VGKHVLALAIGLALSLVAIDASWATAHAVLLRSTPSPRQSLSQPPPRVTLLFSEPIDPVFSSVRILDANNQRVDLADSHVDPNDDHQLVASLRPGLTNGIYAVNWRSLSTIDVHPDQGQFPLFVGVPVTNDFVAANPANETTATPATTFGRWWFYVAASFFGGVLATWKLVLSGVLVEQHADVRGAIRRRMHRLIVLGGVLLVLGTLFTALAQAAAAADLPLASAFGQPLADLLLRGRFASIWWPRLGLEVTSLVLIAFGGLEGLAADCALATLPAVLLTSSLTSHGAALSTGTGPGILIDWLHIVGATAWVGGLLSMLLVLPSAQRASNAGLVVRLLARFGRFALAAAALVVLSGTLQAAFELGTWSALIETLYGRLVLLKIGLLAAMLLVAVFNDWRGRRSASEVSGLRRGVRAEFALGVVVLAIAAVLSGTPPNREAGPSPLASQQTSQR
jgi:copper transport protein